MKRLTVLVMLVLAAGIVPVEAQKDGGLPAITPENAAQLAELSAVDRSTFVSMNGDDQPGGRLSDLNVTGDRLALIESRTAGRVHVWDINAGQVVTTLSMEQATSLAFSPDGMLWVGNRMGTLTAWDLADTTIPQMVVVDAHADAAVEQIAVSPDGRYVATASTGDGMIRVWDGTCQPVNEIQVGAQAMPDLAFTPDGARLAAPLAGVRVWDAVSAQLAGKWALDAGKQVAALAFGVDGARLYASYYATNGGAGSGVLVLDPATGAVLDEWANGGAVQGVTVNAAGSLLVVSGTFDGGGFQVWDAATGAHLVTVPLGGGGVHVTPDDTRLVFVLADGTLRVWGVSADGGVDAAGTLPVEQAAEVATAYLQAEVAADAGAAQAVSCPAWQDTARRDALSFASVDATLLDLTCEPVGTDGSAALVACGGAAEVNYDGDIRELAVDVTFRMVPGDDVWTVCGVVE